MIYVRHVAIAVLFLSVIESSSGTCVGQCHNSNIDSVARVVHGEARGENQTGQLAVAYTIVNRANHRGYPNTVADVIGATYKSGIHTYHQYNTLDDANHDTEWNVAKAANNTEYTHAVKAAKDALCECEDDPTTCATDYCARDPCSATTDNKYFTATGKIQIGNHWFVCRTAVVG